MIPVSEPLIGEQEGLYVAECIRTGWVSSAGRFIEAFEEKWANYCGMKHGVAVTNGTTALETAVECLDLGAGDDVIIPTFTIISCASAVVIRGATPVLVDCDPRTWCMDVNQVAARITPRTRAVMPVHIYGHPVDMAPLWSLAEKHGLAVIEDAAEAHGAEYLNERNPTQPEWRRCGGLGTVSTFSFYANKLITTGEGGMLLTNDERLAACARGLRNLCFRPEKRFYHTELGHNFRLTNIQAAMGLAQLERMESIIEKKRWMGRSYTERLREVPGLQLPVEENWARSVYWMYGIVLEEGRGMDAVEFGRRLKAEGVDTRPFFLGIHEQPVLRKRGLFGNESYPHAERLSRQGLYLPSGLTLSQDQLDTVCDTVRRILK